MIEYITKDITTVEKGLVCHGVNCQHKMASGVAKAIRAKWPTVYEHYMSEPKGASMLGRGDIVTIKEDSLYVVNCYTQNFYGYGGGRYANIDAIRRSLTETMMAGDYHQLPIYLPKIGCGLGGLNWGKEVEPVIISLNTFFDQVKIYVCELGE